MDNNRYGLLIRFKAALDNAYQKRDPLSLQTSEYDKTLNAAKLAGFKVFRNSTGIHKLVDAGESETMNYIREIFAGYYMGR